MWEAWEVFENWHQGVVADEDAPCLIYRFRQLTREAVCATGFGAKQVEWEGQPNGRFLILLIEQSENPSMDPDPRVRNRTQGFALKHGSGPLGSAAG